MDCQSWGRGELQNDAKLGTFVKQGSFYKTWYLNWGTEDKDWNNKIIELYKQATVNVLNGADAKKELGGLANGIKQVSSK